MSDPALLSPSFVAAFILVLAGAALQVAVGTGLSVVCGAFLMLWLGPKLGIAPGFRLRAWISPLRVILLVRATAGAAATLLVASVSRRGEGDAETDATKPFRQLRAFSRKAGNHARGHRCSGAHLTSHDTVHARDRHP